VVLGVAVSISNFATSPHAARRRLPARLDGAAELTGNAPGRRSRAAARDARRASQRWRRTASRQLALAHEAGVSPRHLCFLETGRARPSREMIHRLAETLAVPLRERNELLVAAGFAPTYREGGLDLSARELAPVRAALDAILRQQEPFPAVDTVNPRRFNIMAKVCNKSSLSSTMRMFGSSFITGLPPFF
jgi:transcriptional regulator with XRE-family HTH domain